jgi:RNA polymerase sigma factor (sigma-70 family)
VQKAEQTPAPKPIDWDALHAGYLRGDDARAEELFEHITHNQLPRILRGIDPGLNEHQVADLVARINYKLHHDGKMGQYRGPETFLSWLRTLARSERADLFREKQRMDKVIAGSTDDEDAALPEIDTNRAAGLINAPPGSAIQTVEILHDIAAGIVRLPPAYREVIELQVLHEGDAAKIAAELGETVSNTYVLLHRARQKLTEDLEKNDIRIRKSRKKVKDNRRKDVSA